MEQFLDQLSLSTFWQESSQVKMKDLFHPYRSAEIYLKNNLRVGVFGQIHPILANKLSISSSMYLFEFDIEAINLQLQANTLPSYRSYSFYPKITKNLSFIISKTIKFKEIENLLYWNGTKFLSKINLVDEYRGESISEDCTSLCLELVFQSDQKTLENKTIDSIIENLQLLLTQKLNAILRK